jgi:hypothetical protein
MKLSPKLNLPIPEGSDIHNLTNFVALLNAIDNNAASLGAMNDHVNNKNNPHAVTKTQVGLGQVNNVPQYSKIEVDSKLSDLSKLTQLPANSVPSTGTPASFPIGITAMTVTSGDYPEVTTNSPGTLMTVRGSNDRGTYQLLSGNGTPQQRAYDGAAWSDWSTVATTASNVASASKLANARKIGGVNFDGTSDVTLPGVNAPGNQSTSGKAATAGRADEATHADNATSANKLTTARKIGGVNFDGTSDVTLPGVNTAGNQDTSGRAATAGTAESVSDPTVVHTGSSPTFYNVINTGSTYTPNIELSSKTPFIDFHFNDSTDDFTSRIIESNEGVLSVAKKDSVPGTLQAGTFEGNLHGNADTATKLTLKPNLADGTDLDTIQTTGLYPWGGVTLKNGPFAYVSWGYMSVIDIGGGVMQTFYPTESNQIYHRVMAGNPAGWRAWQKVIFDGDKIANASHADTADQVSDPTVVHTESSPTFHDVISSGAVSTNAIEISSKTPFIDFHFDHSTDDFTSRIAEYAPGIISVLKGGETPATLRAGTFQGYLDGKATSAGNADTATKLQTARSINGVGFDGSSDIMVNPVVRFIDQGTDLFTLPNGFYCCGGVALPNAPAGVGTWFVVEVVQNSSNGFMRLIDNNGSSFWTTKTDSKWQNWHRDADDSTVVHNSGAETIFGTKNFHDVLTASAGVKGDVNGSLHGNADTATHANSATTAEHLLNAQLRELTDADRGNDAANINVLTGTLKRTGNIVAFYANFQVKDAPTVSYSMLNAVKIPVGYRSSASAMPINIQQDTSNGNDQAIVAGDAVLIQTHGANGLTFIGGMWITADDMP